MSATWDILQDMGVTATPDQLDVISNFISSLNGILSATSTLTTNPQSTFEFGSSDKFLRVRQVLTLIKYKALVRRGFLTHWESRLPESTTVVRHHLPVVKGKYDTFGLIMELLVRMAFFDLNKELVLDEDLAECVNLDSAGRVRLAIDLTNRDAGRRIFTYEQLEPYAERLCERARSPISKWPEKYGMCIQSGCVLQHGMIQGHPDVVTESGVYDVKTTSSFRTMAKDSILQVLFYFMLGRLQGYTWTRAGIILPMQRITVCFNLEKWNWRPLWDYTHRVVEHELTPRLSARMTVRNPHYHVGSHLGREDGQSMLDALRKTDLRSCQMFLYGNVAMEAKDATKATLRKDIPALCQVITERNIAYFTHAPYSLNPSRQDLYHIVKRSLRHELQVTAAIGGRGVVIHTGKAKQNTRAKKKIRLSEDEALDIMERVFRKALVEATSECPLLLETPCGGGSELCSTPEDMGAFFKRFTTSERAKLGLCLDTCHVFAAGYWPMEYIEMYTQQCDVPIRLIHFNDSETHIGSCRDLHHPVGYGKIGPQELGAVLDWAAARQVPLVRE